MHFGRVKVRTSGSEATINRTRLASLVKTCSEEKGMRLTLAMPIGEAASDIAGAMLELKYRVRQ